MSRLMDFLKNTNAANYIRTNKWMRRTHKGLFSDREIARMERFPETISEAISAKLRALPDGGKSKLAELEHVCQRSTMNHRADIETVKQDMLYCHFAYGFTFNEYVCYEFADRGPEERKTFLSDRDAAWLCYRLNDLRKMNIMANKAKTYERFSSYYGRKAVVISQADDWDNYCAFVENHRIFVKKNVLESCGRSVELIDFSQRSETPRELFDQWVLQGTIMLEEVVVQSNDIAQFNADSVNTLRCITLKTKDGIVAPFFFLRAGRKGAFVDNGAAGGIIVAVDTETGVLGQGVDEFGNRFDVHPDSEKQFLGFPLPEYNQAKEMCCQMAAQIPELGIIGWDLAHTDNGWVVIEGNSMTEAIGVQGTQRRGIREDLNRLRLK